MEISDFMKSVTREAGGIVKAYYKKSDLKKRGKKHKADIVTEADEASNNFLVDKIKSNFPEHGIISEEIDNYNSDSEYVWVIDPLDGTRNFSTGFPLYGVMVALVRNREVIMGAVYHPYFDNMYFAEKSKGAYKNNEVIKCNDVGEFNYSYGCMAASKNSYESHGGKILSQDSAKSVWVNSFGSAAFAYTTVADGTRDWAIVSTGGIWDVAAPYIILKESGCKITKINGKDWVFHEEEKELFAANPKLHSIINEMLGNV